MTGTTTTRRFGVNAGLSLKVPVITASTGNVTLSGEQTIDGIALIEGDRVLLTDQTDTVENGVWDVSTGSWRRSPDFDAINDVVEGTRIPVNRGSSNANSIWRVSTTGTITPGTTALTIEIDSLDGGTTTAANVVYDPGWANSLVRDTDERLQEKVSILDFDVDPTLSSDSTGGFEDAIALGDNHTIYIPKGRFAISSTLAVTAESMYFVGEGGLNSELYFDPIAADVMFYVHDNGAVYFRGGFKDLFFNSADTTHQKTAILLEDTSEYMIHGCTAHGNSFNTGWSDAGFDSVFLHTKGRDSLSVRDLNVVADIPLKMDINPNASRLSILDADHFNFHNFFPTVPSGADTPCVRIMNGVNLADVSFSGVQPWVRPGGHGLEWIDTTNNSIASLNLTLDGIGLEQMQDTSKYNIYISKTGTNNLRGLHIRNCGLDGLANGFFFRNTRRIGIDQGYITTTTAKEVLNVDGTCDDISWRNFDWGINGTVTDTGMESMLALKKVATTAPLPENGHYVDSAANTYQQDGLKIFSGRTWNFGGTLAHGATYDLPCSPANFLDAGIVNVWAYNNAGGFTEGGVVGVSPFGATILARSSTTFSSALSTGELSIYVSGSITTVSNETGHELDLAISADYKV